MLRVYAGTSDRNSAGGRGREADNGVGGGGQCGQRASGGREPRGSRHLLGLLHAAHRDVEPALTRRHRRRQRRSLVRLHARGRRSERVRGERRWPARWLPDRPERGARSRAICALRPATAHVPIWAWTERSRVALPRAVRYVGQLSLPAVRRASVHTAATDWRSSSGRRERVVRYSGPGNDADADADGAGLGGVREPVRHDQRPARPSGRRRPRAHRDLRSRVQSRVPLRRRGSHQSAHQHRRHLYGADG